MQTSKPDKGSKRTKDFDPEVRSWMKSHTVGDLENLAQELESKGKNADEVKAVVEACKEIEHGQLPRMGDS